MKSKAENPLRRGLATCAVAMLVASTGGAHALQPSGWLSAAGSSGEGEPGTSVAVSDPGPGQLNADSKVLDSQRLQMVAAPAAPALFVEPAPCPTDAALVTARRSVGRSAAKGALIGGSIGAALGVLGCALISSDDYWGECTAAAWLLVPLANAGLGAAIGAGIGALTSLPSGDKWWE